MINNTLEVFYNFKTKSLLFSASEEKNISVFNIPFEDDMVYSFRVWAINIVGAVSTRNITVCKYIG